MHFSDTGVFHVIEMFFFIYICIGNLHHRWLKLQEIKRTLVKLSKGFHSNVNLLFFLDLLITFTSFFLQLLLITKLWGKLLQVALHIVQQHSIKVVGWWRQILPGKTVWWKREKGCFCVGGLSYFCRICIYWYVFICTYDLCRHTYILVNSHLYTTP